MNDTQPMTPDAQQPTEYTDERIAELREEFALPDTFDPNTFPPTKTKGMKGCISGMTRNGKRFIDEGEYDTAKGYFEFFDDMAHQLNQGYYDAAVIINKLLAEIERLQKLTLAFHEGSETPKRDIAVGIIHKIVSIGKDLIATDTGEYRNDKYHEDIFILDRLDSYEESVEVSRQNVLGWWYESDLLRAFEAHLKQKGA